MNAPLLRVAAASFVLYGALALGAFLLLTTPAWPADGPLTRKGDRPFAGLCTRPLSLFTNGSEYRRLTGYQARQYMVAAGVPDILGIDTVSYTMRGAKIPVVYAKRGCVMAIDVVPASEHRAVMELAFGASLYPAGGRGETVREKDGPVPVQAQMPPDMPCGPRDKLVEGLAKDYKEQQAGFGLVAPTVMAEVFVAPSGSWTMLMSYAKGVSCVVATGQHWTNVKVPVPGTDS